jgi:hypothetical protein
MTTEPEPTLDDVPLESATAAQAAEPETEEEVAETRPWRPALDDRAQLAVGAGIAVAVIALLGIVLGAWSWDFGGLILIVAGLVAAGAAYVTSGKETGTPMIAPRDLILAGGTIAAALGVLFVAEILFDLDNLSAYGDVLGLTLTLGLGIAGVALYFAATQWWTGGPVTPWTTALASGDRATRLVFIGAGLVLIGWLGNVTFGIWFLRAGTEVITFVLLAALVMRAAADPEEPLRLPIPPGFVALALSIVAAIIALQHMGVFIGETTLGVDDWLAQLLYVAGVAVALAGSGIAASEGARTMTEGPTGATPRV